MWLNLRSLEDVARRYPSPTSNLYSHAQMCVMEHDHEVDEHV